MEEKPKEKTNHEENVGMAVIAYFLFFVPLLTDSKEDPFVKFHVKQGLLIFSISMGFYILRFFPLVGRLFWIIYPFATFALFALFIIGILNAINGQKRELPIIGKYAEKWFKF